MQLEEGGEGGYREDKKKSLAGFHIELSNKMRYVSSKVGVLGGGEEVVGKYLMAAKQGSISKGSRSEDRDKQRAVDLLNCSVPAVSNLMVHQLGLPMFVRDLSYISNIH